jgi:diguanylate cyclase (GGDEF)-like protein
VSSDQNTQSPENLLNALPFAAALLTGAGSDRPTVKATNAAWQTLWQPYRLIRLDGREATAAPTETVAGLDPLFDTLVEAGQARRLCEAVAAGSRLDLDLALDLDGPVLWHARGAGLGADYLLTVEPIAEPERLAESWPGEDSLGTPALGFRYTAGLAPDGAWQIGASAPDYRTVLGLGPASDGWLRHAVHASRRALRSRQLQLLAGKPQTLAYELELPPGRQVTLLDTALPIRHPGTGEVIGLVGWAQLGGKALTTDTARITAALTDGETAELSGEVGLNGTVRALDALDIAALLLSRQGRILAVGEKAARRLGQATSALHLEPAWPLLLTDETIADASFAALLNDLLDPEKNGMTSTLSGRADATTGLPLEVALLPLDLAGDRLILVTLEVVSGRMASRPSTGSEANENVADSRLRDALYFDPVTGLPNRFLCLDRLRQTIARTVANGGLAAVLVLEIDRLALVERSFGRAAADALLEALAGRLAAAIGDLDTAAHLGGERFAVVAGNLTGVDDAAKIAQLLLDQLQAPIAIAEREVGTSGHVGIAVSPDDGETAETLLAHAEVALERVTKGQGPAYQFYSAAMNTASSDRLLLEQQLLEAIERDEFLLLYQPQISFASSRIVGMEALIRWRHPELGMVPPAEFIPLAEDTGAIVPIGEWVMRTACRELVRWLDAGVAPLRLALNISGRQYNDPNLVPSVRRVLEETGFPPHLLELELTESVIMEDVVDAAKRLGDLHALGINLAVDDFGTGYSSLSYLKRFPIRSLKVDRSFVRDIAHNESSAAIARAIIAFGSALGLKVIAEGVESHDQYDILRGCGCDELQGYLFSRPIPAEEAKKLATERRHLPLVRV